MEKINPLREWDHYIYVELKPEVLDVERVHTRYGNQYKVVPLG